MSKLFSLTVFASLILATTAARADCLNDNHSRVQAEAASALNRELSQKDKRGLTVPDIGVGGVTCSRGTNFNPLGEAKHECRASKSSNSKKGSYSYSCTAVFYGCVLSSSSCIFNTQQ